MGDAGGEGGTEEGKGGGGNAWNLQTQAVPKSFC